MSASPALLLAQQGNQAARAQLLREHGPAVWGLCRRLSAEPEDDYQAIWLHALAQLDRFDPAGRASFRTWLLTLAHRKLIDAHRSAVVRGPTLEPVEPAHAPDPEQDLDRARQRARLEAAIAQLPPDQARVVLLHHLHGQPLSAIAKEEEVAVGTLKSRLHRARARLLTLLEDA
ncbi:MAG: sigma-70 family RNA polymerase sigma factor [Myxococcota bacterium]|nr:sigma-70 family RNA polymerase sigma factor [Myxococcota bacterium]